MIRLLEDRFVAGSPVVVAESSDWRRSPAPLSRPAEVSAGSDILEGQEDSTVYKVAATRRELHAAMRLVHDNYVRLGLIKPKKYGMHVAPQHALPTTEVLVAARRGEVIGTVSIIGDSGYGLPLESIYADEVEAFRQAGLCLAEVGCLADKQDQVEGMAGALFRLMALVAQRSRRHGVDVLLVVCHPRHAKFYERFLGFQQFGEEKPYEKVCGAPAVALALDLHGLREYNPRAYRRLFGDAFSDETLRRSQVAAHVLAELQEIVEEHRSAHAGQPAAELACA